MSVYPRAKIRDRHEPTAPLRAGHHLVYFPPAYALSSLLPDGTDPEQSPGDPYVRRMWAGGRIQFFPAKDLKLRLHGKNSTCLERISNVSMKGREGEEKVFVTIERRFEGTVRKHSRNKGYRDPHKLPEAEETEESIRARLMSDEKCSLIEERNIVFMRERSSEEAGDASTAHPKIVKPPHEPSYSAVLTPTPSLLFRFSALTFNAHRIHLDKLFCRDTEGHRNLLVHGPLSLVFMLELLNRYLAQSSPVSKHHSLTLPQAAIESVEYRNVAPLYAEEPMKICLRERDEHSYDLWVENRDGGLAVKGTATTLHVQDPFR